MKRRYIVLGLVVLLMLVVVLAIAGPASAGALKTAYTTTSTPGGDLDPGVWKLPPVGSMSPVMQYRYRVFEAVDVCSDPRMSGDRVLTEHVTLNFATMTGVGGGTYRVTTATGVWEGTYTETFDLAFVGPDLVITVTGRGVAHGTAGDVVGLQARWTSTSPPGVSAVYESGYIIDK